MAIDIVRRHFTVDDYARMLAAGILAEDDRVELIDGEVREMSPIGPYHAAIVNRLVRLIGRRIPHMYSLSVQNPVRLSDNTEPQPDVAIVYTRDDDYALQHPLPPDIVVIIEVADSSVAYDREEKLPRYAQADIGEIWLIDIGRRQIEQYTQPQGDQYAVKQTWRQETTIAAVSIPTLQLLVDEVFP